MSNTPEAAPARPASLTRYQRYVVFCAWLGLGFDLMDSLLFNLVSPICIPDLLGLSPTSPGGKGATGFWTGVLTSVMLFGWSIGGVFFGKLSDSIGRTRTVVLTMLIYSLGTGACALAPNVYVLGLFRFITALGIGGEWAAGAILVAETVPEERRVQMGTFLFTSPPFFVFLATFVNWLLTRQITSIASSPGLSWRLLLGFGALPALVALFIRRGLKEPEHWQRTERRKATIGELFSPALRRRTLGGVLITTVALVSFWVVSAFLPMVASFIAEELAAPPESLGALKASFISRGMAWFNFGGLIGVILAAPLALRVGRRPMYFAYFAWSALTIGAAFGLPLAPASRLIAFAFMGISVYGIFGSFQFYLPELFPTHLRGTGAGFCLNMGRFITVIGPFAVGLVARRGMNPVDIVRWVAVVPAVGLLCLALGVGAETRGEKLVTTSGDRPGGLP
jgi:MFS family permease